MARTVVLIDGEYVRKIFQKLNYRVDVPSLVDKILELSHIDKDKLLRVYYYTSPPYQAQNPTQDEKNRYRGFQRFIDYLNKQESFEVKLGRLEKRGNIYNQKMVDVLLSIDLVDLSAKSKIDTAILVAGDSDFVPAVKAAKNNGTRIFLCCSSDKKQYHMNLWKNTDKRFEITEDIMKECSYTTPIKP